MSPTVTVLGAGVAGLVSATALVQAGHRVRVYDPSGIPGRGVSTMAGGMLAPFSELDHLALDQLDDARMGVSWWRARAAELGFSCPARGTLVVAHHADRDVLARFEHDLERVPGCFDRLDRGALREREPVLGARFEGGLHVPGEAFLEPKVALASLADDLRRRGVELVATTAPSDNGLIVDCRGMAAPDPALRPVRGEIAFVRAPDVTLQHCVRLMHPRIPLYVVPHGGGVFAVGATMVESSDHGGVTVGSALHLLSAATLLHPGFIEAEIVALRSGLRPAYANNRPTVRRRAKGVLSVNGLFRHGYLMSPALAAEVVRALDANEEGA